MDPLGGDALTFACLPTNEDVKQLVQFVGYFGVCLDRLANFSVQHFPVTHPQALDMTSERDRGQSGSGSELVVGWQRLRAAREENS